MQRTPVLAAAAAAAVVATVPVAAAQEQQNADPHAKAEFLGAVRAARTQATIRVRYRCNAGEALWVSVKQSASGRRDTRLTREGSSKVASAWWQSHRNRFTCDDRFHTATFTVDKVEEGSKGRLRTGTAWIQFCVTDDKGKILVLSQSAWVRVKRR